MDPMLLMGTLFAGVALLALLFASRRHSRGGGGDGGHVGSGTGGGDGQCDPGGDGGGCDGGGGGD